MDGGVEAVILNYFRNINKSKFVFDFVIDSDSTDNNFINEIQELGGTIIKCPPYQKLHKYNKFLYKLFKEKKYDIVHSNINTLSVFPLRMAEKAGIKIRIAHSHSTSNPKEWKKNLLKNILRPFSKKYANVYFACSELAGRYLFGNKAFDEGKVIIFNNAINLDKFKYNEEKRKEIRKKINIKNDTFVIGHIGRFVAQKNHTFLIDIFNEMHKENENSVLLLIGQGTLQNEIKEKVDKLGLANSVKFIGQVTNANDYYNAMDVFVLPSIYEGLGMVLIEAQANELPCIASTEVPKEATISNQIEYIELDKNPSYWAKRILNKSRSKVNFEYNEKIEKYNIKNVVGELENEYINVNNNINGGEIS